MEVSALLVLCMIGAAVAFPQYQTLIPNGDRVPHPCKPNYVWHGVGHHNPMGAGVRNIFGEDFQAAGKKWTQHLCRMDSDGDGKTNGEELGDPNCIWRPGTFPAIYQSSRLSHPGICDPWNSTMCRTRNTWLTCDVGEFNCPAVNQTGVKSTVLQFPKTKVPNTVTNYYCMTFDLPQDGDYHMIASQPVLDNVDVMHHILLYGCRDNVKASSSPHACYMAQAGCFEVIGMWTVGFAGQCLYKDTGFRIGTRGFKVAALEFHWNNPDRRDDYWDGSGFRIYYTPHIRPYDAGVLMIGQEYIDIEPGRVNVSYTGTCPAHCLRDVSTGPVYITTAVNHMHYLGISQNVEQIRNGTRLRYITDDQAYSYDSPVIHEYNPPLNFHSGDSLKTTCTYRSISKGRTTYYGEGTNDEMCYALITYFPKQNLKFDYGSCVDWKGIHVCDIVNNTLGGCPLQDFINRRTPALKSIYDKIMDNCNHYGPCRTECPAAIASVRSHPCLRTHVGEFVLHHMSRSRDLSIANFAHAFHSCDCPHGH